MAIAVLAFGVASCADKTVGPEQEIVVPFAISNAQRATLTGALRFAARDAALQAMAESDARAQVVAAFARLAERVDANDRSAARRAIVAARELLRLYGERAGSDLSVLLEVESLSLALDHAELLAADAPAASLYRTEGSGESR
jgi:hypothetical protein